MGGAGRGSRGNTGWKHLQCLPFVHAGERLEGAGSFGRFKRGFGGGSGERGWRHLLCLPPVHAGEGDRGCKGLGGSGRVKRGGSGRGRGGQKRRWKGQHRFITLFCFITCRPSETAASTLLPPLLCSGHRPGANLAGRLHRGPRLDAPVLVCVNHDTALRRQHHAHHELEHRQVRLMHVSRMISVQHMCVQHVPITKGAFEVHGAATES